MSNIVNFDNIYKADCISKLSKPYEEYDVNGRLIGYSWVSGENVNLKFDITGYVTVDSDSIIYTATGETPNTNTEGAVGMKCYNVVDLKSWTCAFVIESEELITYVWEQDSEFTYPMDGDKNIYLSANEYIRGKALQISIVNTHYEQIYSDVIEANTSINFPITDEIAKLLVSGTYYLRLSLVDSDNYKVLNILSDTDCTLFIK